MGSKQKWKDMSLGHQSERCMSEKSHIFNERRTMPRTMCEKAISSGSEIIYRV